MVNRHPPIAPLLESEWRQFQPTLHRIAAALQALGSPESAFPHILVGGTNGKGTVSWNLAQNLPGKVGLFLSPHLVDVRERILVDGRGVPDHLWISAHEKACRLIPKVSLSYFEWLVLVAAEVFKSCGVSWAVFEVGLGGRFDATNSLNPCISVITSVGLDHVEILGDTKEKIALEKIEIARSGRPLVIPEEVVRLPGIGDRLEEMGPRILPVKLKTPPTFLDNDILVNKTLRALRIPRRTQKLQSLPGRRSRLDIGAGVYLDGAHNPMAWSDCARWVEKELPSNMRLLCGISEGRDPAEFLALLKPVVSQVLVWRAGFDRELPSHCWPRGTKFVDTPEIPSLFDQPLLVCGSLYLLGRFLDEFCSGDISALKP